DVVAHPVVLADARQRDRVRLLAADPAAIEAEHAGLVHEQAALGAGLDEAVTLRRQHGVALADQQRVLAHLQAREATGDVAGALGHAGAASRNCGRTFSPKASMKAAWPRLTLCSSSWSTPIARSSRSQARCRDRSAEMRTAGSWSSALTNVAAASNCSGVRRSSDTVLSNRLVRHCSSVPSRAASS